MARYGFAAVLVAALCSRSAGETYLDKVTAVDAGKRTITLAVDGKDRTLAVDEQADIQQQVKVGKRLRVSPFRAGLKGIKVGDELTLTTERKDGREVVTKIVVLGGEEKKGK